MDLADRNMSLEKNEESMQGMMEGLQEQMIVLENDKYERERQRRSESPCSTASSEAGASDVTVKLKRECDELKRNYKQLQSDMTKMTTDFKKELQQAQEQLVMKTKEMEHVHNAATQWQAYSQQQADLIVTLRRDHESAALGAEQYRAQLQVSKR